jgi:tetratricopeptide (TPR) repeat protein
MKIAVYAIALNEEKHAEAFMASCRDADLVLIADTGSTDATADRLSALGADVRQIRIDPWRFDAARSAALALLPDDVDACVSLDLDQTLTPGWRTLVEAAWGQGANRLYYPLVHHQAGELGELAYVDNRIHARRGFVWRYPCHECLVPDRIAEHPVVEPNLKVLHAPDLAKSRASYLALLELGAREAPDDPRAAHYLAREYFELGRYAEGARAFERCLALPSSVSAAAERNASLRWLAHCREKLGEGDAALALFRQAVDEEPRLRGAWVELAWAYFRRQAWAECLAAAERAIAFLAVARVYGDDTSPGVIPEDIASLAAWSLGRPADALAYARAALAKAPASPRLRANVERIEAAIASGAKAFGVSMQPLADKR